MVYFDLCYLQDHLLFLPQIAQISTDGLFRSVLSAKSVSFFDADCLDSTDGLFRSVLPTKSLPFLPRIAQIFTDGLFRSVLPTKSLPFLPRIAQIFTVGLFRSVFTYDITFFFSHRLHRFSQMVYFDLFNLRLSQPGIEPATYYFFISRRYFSRSRILCDPVFL